MSDGDIGEGLPGSPSQGGYSETNPIPVDNPPMPKPPSPTPPKPPKPSKPNLMDSLDLPPRRKLSPEECSLWSAVTRWEGVYNASSSTGLDGKFTPIDNTSLSSETKGSARLELEKDPTQSVENIRLVWKGTATLVEATHKTKTHVDLNPLNPVFGGKNDANESGSGNAGSVIEGDVYLTIDCYMGWYTIRVPDAKIKTHMTSGGNVTAFAGSFNEPIHDSAEKEESLSFHNTSYALPAFTDPDNPPVLKGKADINTTFLVSVKIHGDWDLSSKTVKADAGGPYTTERGSKLTLDASKSKPLSEIKEFEWTFAAPDNPEPVADGYPPYQPPRENAIKKTESPKSSVVILGNVKVRVKVTTAKGATHTSEWTTITAKPRNFAPVPVAQITTVKHPDLVLDGAVQFGRNTCSLDKGPVGRDEAEHYYHRDPAKQTWLDTGYKVEQVDDSADGGEGPFHGFYFVSKHHTLRISRQRAVNKKITPQDTTGVYAYNEQMKQPPPPPKPGSNQPHPYVCGCDRLAKCVEQHEQLHTDMVLEAARGSFKNVTSRSGPVDPTKRIEKLYYETQDQLVTWADIEIRYSDMECQAATAGKDREAEIQSKLIKMGYSDTVIVYLPGSQGGWKTLEGVLGSFGE